MERRIGLNAGWQLASSADVHATGREISTPGWTMPHALAVELPATVLGALVDAGRHGDPFYGDALRRIPGQGPPAQNFSNHPMPADSPFAVPWWFRRELRVPAGAGEHLRLRFDGINYRANVWLNGELVASDREVVGAYREIELDVSTRLRRDGINAIALEVAAPKPCDLALTWVDWNPSPPDKNMGLWRDVWLCQSGAIALADPHVRTRLVADGSAELTVGGDLVNLSARTEQAIVHGRIGGERFTFVRTVPPHARVRFDIDADEAPALRLRTPALWWPRPLGEPHLYECELEVEVDGAHSDGERVAFGVREIAAAIDARGHTQFFVNREPVLIRGAGWACDLFLRRDRDRELAQLRYVQELNLNTIRFEGMLERAEILEHCDREGILVIAGWCCCDQWERWSEWKPENHRVAVESLRAQLRRVRRHPCLAAWWYGSDFAPPPATERAYLDVLEQEHWPNPSHSSASHRPAELTGSCGLKMQGPYDWVPPVYWLEDRERGGAHGFATEICPGPAVPPLESLVRMLPPEHHWPIDDMWSFHCGGQEFHGIATFATALRARLGETDGIAAFAELAQLMCYEAQRAMFEAYTVRKGVATGVVQWMLNNAWPSLIWHLFDWYLRPGGGFFGTRKACQPLHVLYTADDDGVWVTNEHLHAFAGLRVLVRALDLEARVVFSGSETVSVAAGGVVRVLGLPPHAKRSPLSFVDLRLFDGARELDVNFYWLPATPDVLDHEGGNWITTPCSQYADLGALRRLAPARVQVRAHAIEPGRAIVELENPGSRLAFFVQLRLATPGGEDVLPVSWSDNYVSLLPGETRCVQCSFAPRADARVEVCGLNVALGAHEIRPSLVEEPPIPGMRPRGKLGG